MESGILKHKERKLIMKIQDILLISTIIIAIAVGIFISIYVICSPDIPTWAKWLILLK